MASDKNRSIIANYDQIARSSPLDIIVSGRYALSALGYPRRLGLFLAQAMELKPEDRLLDAGCSVGIYHPVLAPRVRRITGVDASPQSIARAQDRHKDLANVDYRAADILALKAGDFGQGFDKILCYSVVHFLEGAAELEALLNALAGLLESRHGMIYLGEVRDKELYERFRASRQNRSWPTLRDLKFRMLNVIQNWLMPSSGLTKGISPTVFGRQEIERIAARLGAKACERLEQAPWHPFYNTCVDYRLRF